MDGKWDIHFFRSVVPRWLGRTVLDSFLWWKACFAEQIDRDRLEGRMTAEDFSGEIMRKPRSPLCCCSMYNVKSMRIMS